MIGSLSIFMVPIVQYELATLIVLVGFFLVGFLESDRTSELV